MTIIIIIIIICGRKITHLYAETIHKKVIFRGGIGVSTATEKLSKLDEVVLQDSGR